MPDSFSAAAVTLPLPLDAAFLGLLPPSARLRCEPLSAASRRWRVYVAMALAIFCRERLLAFIAMALSYADVFAD